MRTINKQSRLKVPDIPLFFFFVVFPVFAANSSEYETIWSSFNGTGHIYNGVSFILIGTIGHQDNVWLSGGEYEMTAGFRAADAPCVVDFKHLAAFSQYWMSCGQNLPSDFFPDGTVNKDDLLVFLEFWLCKCPVNWPFK